MKGPYAAVVLAAPLEQSQLQFSGFEPPSIPTRKYQTTVTTIVRGSLAPSFFNVATVPPGGQTPPGCVAPTQPSQMHYLERQVRTDNQAVGQASFPMSCPVFCRGVHHGQGGCRGAVLCDCPDHRL